MQIYLLYIPLDQSEESVSFQALKIPEIPSAWTLQPRHNCTRQHRL